MDADGFVNTLAADVGLKFGSLAAGKDSLFALGASANSGLAVLYSIAPSTGKLTALTKPGYQPGKTAGQLVTQTMLSADTSTPMATDRRGLLYLPDRDNRRIMVIGAPVEVVVQTEPSGLTVLVDGVSVTAPQTFRWLPGDYHTVEADSNSGGMVFDSWSHGDSSKIKWLPPSGQSTVTARFR